MSRLSEASAAEVPFTSNNTTDSAAACRAFHLLTASVTASRSAVSPEGDSIRTRWAGELKYTESRDIVRFTERCRSEPVQHNFGVRGGGPGGSQGIYG